MKPKPTVAEMARHVAELIKKHEITASVTPRRPTEAWAINEQGITEISIPPVRSATSYATALHEIGHILGRHQASRRVMVREQRAWRWAQENALVWTSAMEKDRVESLAYYASRKLPRLPPPSEPTQRLTADQEAMGLAMIFPEAEPGKKINGQLLKRLGKDKARRERLLSQARAVLRHSPALVDLVLSGAESLNSASSKIRALGGEGNAAEP